MSWCIYLTHPEVTIDPSVPVPEWGLSALGHERAKAATELPFSHELGAVVSSAETKALETAQAFVERFGISHEIYKDLHENDRSATGFLPQEEFEQTANMFFANPDVSVRGWERARDAQERIVRTTRQALTGYKADLPVLFAGHGAAGTLLMCHLMGVAISREHDQERGGCWYRFHKDWLTTKAGRGLRWTEV